jgi:hypothetical protein
LFGQLAKRTYFALLIIGTLEYWNNGTMGSGLRLVGPTARKGKWDNGLLGKIRLDMEGVHIK